MGIRRFFRSLLNEFDYDRREVKAAITHLAFLVIILVIVETGIVAFAQRLMYPAVAIVGVVWILGITVVIWMRGGAIMDSAILGRIFGIKAGKVVTNAIIAFLFIQCVIVTFFLLIPIWKFWSGYFVLLIAILGLISSGILAEREWNWKAMWSIFAVLAMGVLLIIILVAGYEFATDKKVNGEFIKKQTVSVFEKSDLNLSGQVKKLANRAEDLDLSRMSKSAKFFILALGLIAGGLILGLILPKKDGKRRGGWLTSLGLLSLFIGIVLALFTPELKAIEAPKFDGGKKQTTSISNVPQREIYTEIINLRGYNCPSEKYEPQTGVDFRFYGPGTTASVSLADCIKRPISEELGVDSRWLRGFRFLGPEGQTVTVKWWRAR